jgi:hypothetical protein
MILSEMTTRNRTLWREFDQLRSSAQEVCSCVLGSPPSSPLQDDLRRVPKELAALTAIAAYHGASTALSAVVLWHPELDLAGLEDDLFVGKPYDDVLVVARRLEPIADKVARGLTFSAVRRVRRAERELDVSGGSAGAMADASSTGGSAAPSSSVDPPLQK